jgi:hypothetical protein
MKLRLPALPGLAGVRQARVRLRGWLRGFTRSSAGDETDSSRMPGQLLGLLLSMSVALSFIALAVLLVAPASSGCGSRQERVAAAPKVSPAPAAPAPGPPITTTAPPPPASAAPSPPPAPPPSALIGDYQCRFTRGERELDPVPCAIRAGADGALRLEQPGGALRLSGTVTEDEAGFRLSGEIECASGPCPGPGSREVLFYSQGPSAYSAVLLLRGGRFLNIDLVRAD